MMGRPLQPPGAPRSLPRKGLWFSVGVLLLVGAATASAAVFRRHLDEDDQYIRVEVRGVLRHGVQALGEATTGTEVTARGVTWELDLSGSEALSAAAKAHNGQVVVVAGLLEMQRRADMQCRWIVRAEKLSVPLRP